MTKELEALKNIDLHCNHYEEYEEDMAIVEKALKEKAEIEEKLGLPLITYFKLIYATHVYCWGYGNTIMKCNLTSINTKDKCLSCWNGVSSMRKTFDEYGTWWALTKEELENKK